MKSYLTKDCSRELAASQRIFATSLIEEEAVREDLRAAARKEEVEALTRMEGLDLADPDVMSGAWRW